MPRRSLALLLLLLALIAAVLGTAPPGLAAVGDYPDQTAGDAPGTGVLKDVYFALDPTQDFGDVGAQLRTSTQDEEYLVVTLGHLTGTTCDPTWELVVSGYQGEVVVRAPGSTTRPKPVAADSGPWGHFVGATRLHGFVPTCASAELQDADGDVLASRPIEVEATTPPHQHPHTAYDPVYQVSQSTTSEIQTQILPYRYGSDAVLYDGLLRLTHDSGIAVVDDRQPLTEVGGYVTTVLQPDPGFHQLTATVSGGNADTSTQTFTVYAPGAQPPARTGNLAGRSFATGEGAISFVDARYAYVGVPPRGRPRCTAKDVHLHSLTGCLRYEWDVKSNLLRVGDWIGAPDRARTGAHRVRGTFWHDASYCQDFAYPEAGLRLSGAYSLTTIVASEGEVVPDDELRVDFTRNGHFRLSTSIAQATPAHDRGTYAVGPHGVLRLHVGRRHLVGTIGVRVDAHGRTTPGRGVVLDLDAVRRGAHGSFMAGADQWDDSTGHAPSAPATWTPARFGALSCT